MSALGCGSSGFNPGDENAPGWSLARFCDTKALCDAKAKNRGPQINADERG
jgi:hypothetical protein